MAKKKVEGVCPLCQESKTLILSHIIPKFFWKPIKESDGFYVGLSSTPGKKEFKGQKELKEHLLCQNCDGVVLQRYEEHLARWIFQKAECPIDHGRHATLTGIDYLMAKKALLSILWRMSLSKQTFFADVNLGEKHTEAMRRILFTDEDIEEHEYPIIMTVPYLGGEHIDKLILQPTWVRIDDGNRVYRCFVCGFFFAFEVGSAEPAQAMLRCNLKKDGTWVIAKREAQEISHLWEILREVYDNAQRSGRR